MEQNLSVINELLPVMTSGNTGVWVCNTSSGQLDFKNDFFNLLDLTRMKIEFSSLDELRTQLHADDLQTFDEAFAEAFAGKCTTVIYGCRNSEGDTVQLESTLMPCMDGIVACTVNKKRLQQMAHWEKQYRTLVNALFPNFIFVFDEDFHYVDVITPDGLRLFHSKEELIGKDARNYYPPEVGELLSANIRECLRKNEWKEVEHHIELLGTIYYYQARIVPVDGDKAFCLIQDIGDRVRRMEELLVQRQRAEESDRIKSTFLANMSHEIRTPLNAVIGFSEYLVNEHVAEKRQKYIDIIHKSSSMLLQIVNDILDLSRLESGMNEFRFEETDVVVMLMDVIESYLPNMKPGVRLLSDIPDKNITVFTDVNRVKQVLYNLISNAAKYTEKGAIILKVEEDNDFLTFSVIDTGCGIPDDKVKLIFNRFEKLDRFVQGTGLGLAICKSIVERLGGRIEVTSKMGEGSVFSFTIPYRYVAPQRENIGDMRELYANKRKKILVGETSEDEMQYISKILTKKYDVVEITDIEKIITAFIFDQPNLLLVSMEIASKKDIISKIRAITPSIPIIAMTTSDFYHDQRWAVENGCTDAIARPFSPIKLEELVMAFIV